MKRALGRRAKGKDSKSRFTSKGSSDGAFNGLTVCTLIFGAGRLPCASSSAARKNFRHMHDSGGYKNSRPSFSGLRPCRHRHVQQQMPERQPRPQKLSTHLLLLHNWPWARAVAFTWVTLYRCQPHNVTGDIRGDLKGVEQQVQRRRRVAEDLRACKCCSLCPELADLCSKNRAA